MNDRGVSTNVGYVLGLGLVTIVITSLFLVGGTFVSEQRDQTVRAEMQVVGQQLSNDVSRADRMIDSARPARAETVNVTGDLPSDIAGSSYAIQLKPNGGNPYLRLRTSTPEVSVRVNVTTTASVTESRIDGGRYRITLRSGNLVIEDV